MINFITTAFTTIVSDPVLLGLYLLLILVAVIIIGGDIANKEPDKFIKQDRP